MRSGWKMPALGGFSGTLRGVFESLANYIDGRICPVGTVRMSVEFTLEDGWMEIAGQTITNCQTLYPIFYNKVPSDWRSGADVIMPDFRNRYPISVAAGAPETDIGNLIGSHTSTISAGNLPAHAHGFNVNSGTVSADHAHGPGGGGQFVTTVAGGAVYAGGIGGSGASFTTGITANHVHNVSGSTDNGPGSGAAFNTYPASMYLRFSVRVF